VSDAGGGIPPVQPYGQPEGKLPDPEESFSARLALAQRAGGLVAPLLTVVIAFVMGGLVVLITTGKNPLKTYKAIFEGAGLNWFFQIPWDFDSVAAFNLQQTLIQTTTFILVGLAVAFAFRCGLFNIGGQGQYLAGAILAVWIGSSFEDLNPYLHVGLAIVIGTLAGALIAGIAGFLKATVGAHEVISTIMLNWIVLWVGVYLFGLGGPLQNDTQTSVPVSNDVAEGAKLHVFWGDPLLQGLHIGIFFALGALIVYSILLNRTTLGYGVKAVGFNPEAARYGGISVARNYFLAMAISGAFAGLATSSAGSSGSRRATCRPPWSGSPASPWRCSAATPRSAPGSQRCCSARCSPGRRPATSTPTSSSPSSPRTSPS
jgi:simple sugar transport system permease protein